jgi:hypothetical protein
LTVVNPFDNLVWRKDSQAIETSANLASFQFGPIYPAMVMRKNVVVIFAAKSRKDRHFAM